jgi:hypothetical protein
MALEGHDLTHPDWMRGRSERRASLRHLAG